MMLWPNRLIAWLRRRGIVALLAIAAAVFVLWTALGDPGRSPSVLYMRPR